MLQEESDSTGADGAVAADEEDVKKEAKKEDVKEETPEPKKVFVALINKMTGLKHIKSSRPP